MLYHRRTFSVLNLPILGQLAKGLAITLGALLLNGCIEEGQDGAIDGPPPARLWELVWSDEFDGESGEFNLSGDWEIQLGDGTEFGIPGWGNNEEQFYTTDNVNLDGNGNLVITSAADGPGSGYPFTSGRIRTQGQVDITYGRIEARLKTPDVKGTWPAFWLLGSDSGPYGGWAARGEIDVMEAYNRSTPFFTSAAHFGGPFPFNTFVASAPKLIDPADGFHIYAVEWDAESIRWFVDGVNHFSMRSENYWNYYFSGREEGYLPGGPSAPFDADHHIILNVAINGNLPESEGELADPFDFPYSEMLVDYVRVYRCTFESRSAAPGTGCENVAAPTDPILKFLLPEANGFAFRTAYYRDGLTDAFADRPLDLIERDGAGVLVVTEKAPAISDPGNQVLDLLATAGGSTVGIGDGGPFLFFGLGSAGNESDDFLSLADFKFRIYVDGDPGATSLRISVADENIRSHYSIPLSDFTPNQWHKTSVSLTDILNISTGVRTLAATGASALEDEFPDPLALIELIAFELDGPARIQLDDIEFACGGETACGPVDSVRVYGDAIAAAWDRGLVAFDTVVGADYTNGQSANAVTWREVDSEEQFRGRVIETTFKSMPAVDDVALNFIGASEGQDLSGLVRGDIRFDVRVIQNPNIPLFFKVEHGPGLGSGEVPIGVLEIDQWEEICAPVSFLQNAGLQLDGVIAALVLGARNNSGQDLVVQWDNVRFEPQTNCTPNVVVPLNFEQDIVYPFTEFLGAPTTVEDNPLIDIANPSAKVAKMIKFNSGNPSQPFGGSFITLTEAIDFSNGSLFTIKTNTPRFSSAMEILIKLESTSSSSEASLTVFTNPANANQWDTLSLDFTGQEANDYDRIVFLIDPTVLGDGTDNFTLYFDDIEQGVSSLAPPELPVTFDDPGTAYPIFSSPGLSSSVVDDPDLARLPNKVAATFMPEAGRDPFVNVNVGGLNGFAQPIAVPGQYVIIRVDIYAPALTDVFGDPITVLAKLLNSQDQFQFAELELPVTVANQWQTMEFVLPELGIDDLGSFDTIKLFFDFNKLVTSPAQTWYWDNLEIVAQP